MLEYAALDLETTGLDPEHDRVIELGAVAFTVEDVLERLDLLVDPGRSIPAPVLKLTGIQPHEVRGASPQRQGLEELAAFLRDRQPIGHGASLDVDFLVSAGLWDGTLEVIDTLHIARILLPQAPSHSLPVLAAELGLDQPRPHRALDDADATRQLFLRLREEAASLPEPLKEAMLALVAPYEWGVARFFADALTAPIEAVGLAPVPARPAASAGRPRGELPRDDPSFLAGLLGPSGPLATSIPGYEHREGQLQMLLAVAQIFKRGGTLVVEAGTGTGKSLAYLVPALSRSLAHGERVVVSTNTHTLQEQLMTKDLPSLREWLPWDFKACLLKGRPNYVSLRRWRRYLAEPCHDAEELAFKLKVLVWLQRTETGDRSELRLQGREEVLWNRIASDPLDCLGVQCTSEDCFVHRARAEAEAADLVIVNHALLLADAEQQGGILPHYDHLIVDEAHHLEDAATQALRREVDGPGLQALLERLATDSTEPPHERRGLLAEIAARPQLSLDQARLEEAGRLALRAARAVDVLFQALEEFVRGSADPDRREDSIRLWPRPGGGEVSPQLKQLANNAGVSLTALAGTLYSTFTAAREWLSGEQPDQALREMEMIRGRISEAERLLSEALEEPDANRVYWLTPLSRSGSVAVRSAPINVGSLLSERVYAERATVIFTSASLSVGESFDYFRQRVGIEREPEMLRLESPFNYLEQALICLPSGLGEPEHPDFEAGLAETIAQVSKRIGGRTLVLFTSHHQLRDTYYALKQRDDLDSLLILGQGFDGQRRQLLKAFTENERPLLLGTATFWEGIDLPGDQLSCVMVVRLPFPVPTEPVFAARAEQFADSFRNYALPQAVLRLKQGFGRLIRTSADRGAVVILDNRISSREYGNAFLEALPPAPIYDGSLEDLPQTIERWLAGA